LLSTRLRALICLVLAVLLLTGCVSDQVEDLLLAPEMAEDQAKVRKALEESMGEDAAFKYPLRGGTRQRAAILNDLDLDGDGVNEIIAFFSQKDNQLVQIAVLKQVDGEYAVTCVVQGAGIDADSVTPVRMGAKELLLLIQWKGSGANNRITPYRYRNESLVAEFEEDMVGELKLYDFDEDSWQEFVYITYADDAFQLKYVDPSSEQPDGRIYTSDYILDNRMNGVAGITAGELPDGKRAVFIDERNADGLNTEMFVFESSSRELEPALDSSVADLSVRPDTCPQSQILGKSGGALYFPSVIKRSESSFSWLFWYTVEDGELTEPLMSWYSANYQFALFLPLGWELGINNEPEQTEDELGTLIAFYGMGVKDHPLLEIRVVKVGDDLQAFYDDGFETELLGRSSSLAVRFLFKPSPELLAAEGYENIQPGDAEYIRGSFQTNISPVNPKT